ncbi:MAG: 2-hydroxyacyl-CoA dehydratase family protein [Acidobacteriia bacterium]|nr:2-hydroxyacyl-CoA dehydratase family protein [Terriglobia bacterium]
MTPDSQTSLRAAAAEALVRPAGAFKTTCSCVPRELFEAFGLNAPRLLPPGTVVSESRGEARSGPGACAWCKSALGSEEAGAVWVGGATCDQMRRMIEIAGRHSGAAAIVIHIPKTRTAEAEALYLGELEWLAGELTRRTGRALDPASLLRAIVIRDGIRERMRKFRPTLAGPDFAALVQLDAGLPQEETRAILDGWAFGVSRSAGIPILVAGSPHTPADLRWLELLEDAGLSVVADATCTGDRAVDFTAVLDAGCHPLEILARTYFRRPPCPFVRPNDEFYGYTARLAASRGVRGVVWKSVRGCDIHGLEAPRAMRILGLPFLALDVSYGDIDSVRIRMRVEAFAEGLQ